MSSRRKSIPTEVKADRHFPVRVRIPCPPEGMGQRLNLMHHWLYDRVGLKRFFQGGELRDGKDSLFFYFDDLTVAEAFVTHFNCAVIVQGDPPP
jgi:hypothetical protein